MTTAQQFRLDLEMQLIFVPPMSENRPGIALTKSFDLPFPPYNDMELFSRTFPNTPGPEGFRLKNVTWDVERQVFLAYSNLTSIDFPIAFLLEEVQSWIDAGWRLGNLADPYSEDFERRQGQTEQEVADDLEDDLIEDEEEQEEDKWPSLPPRKRPAKFNKLLRAVARVMAELFNNPGTAYAILKTQQFFSDDELKAADSKAASKFRDALEEYFKMSTAEQIDWREKVLKTGPRLDRLLQKSGVS